MSTIKQKIPTVSEILPAIFKDLGRQNISEQLELERLWQVIAGPDTAGVALGGFKEGTVHIIVDSSARLYFWNIRRTTVLKRFQERRPDVKNISFKIGKVP